MSDRIDHVAEAQRSDELTREQWTTFAFETNDASNLYTAIQEQKHAILALVEQQRIANLIALAGMAQHEFGAYAGNAGPFGSIFDHSETEHGNVRLKPDIAAALGVDQS